MQYQRHVCLDALYGELPNRTSIRLLKINPPIVGESEIGCSLTVVDLCSKPSYQALSYTWDQPYQSMEPHVTHYDQEEENRADLPKQPASHRTPNTPNLASGLPPREHKILCNGQSLLITNNLHDALIQLQAMPEVEALWVDAISINQASLSERAQQVALMGRIYAEAERVIVWLGLPTDDFDDFHWALTTFYPKLLDVFVRLGEDFLRKQSVYNETIPYEMNIPDLIERLERYVKFGCSCRWFSRAWVTQEVVTAVDIIVLCGSHAVSWTDLAKLSKIMDQSGASIETAEHIWGTVDEVRNNDRGPFISMWHLQQDRRTDDMWKEWNDVIKAFEAKTDDERSLAILAHVCDGMSLRNCHDPRDRIYSAIGIVTQNFDHSIGRLISQSYETSVAEIFANLMWVCMERGKCLAYLGYVRGSQRSGIAGLPSWASDYQVHIEGHPDPMVYENASPSWDASGWRGRHDFPCSRRGNHLILEGAMFDTISHPCRWTTDEWTERFQLLQAMDDCCSHMHEGLEPKGPDTFWRSFFGDVYGNQAPAPVELGHRFRLYLTVDIRRHIYTASLQSLANEPDLLTHISTLLTKYTSSPSVPTIEETTTHLSQYRLYKTLQPGTPPHTKIDNQLDEITDQISAYRGYTRQIHAQRRHFTTAKQGILGIGPIDIQPDDEIWAVKGANVPFVLRPNSDGTFRFVGECYVHGFMRGEMLGAEKGQRSRMVELDIV